MPSRSSIFSFDTLSRLPRPTRAVWLAVILCAVGRIGLYAARGRLERIPTPNMHQGLLDREQRQIRDAAVKPRIALMGSSHTLYGLCEERLASVATLPPAQVVNLGMETGRAWDALVLIRRNPAFFQDLRVVVFDVGFREIDENAVVRRMPYFYRLATLDEKCRAGRLADRTKLLLDCCWPFESERRDLATWLTHLSGRQEPHPYRPMKPAWQPDKLALLMNRKAEFLQSGNIQEGRGPEAVSWHPSEFYRQLFSEFVAYWRERHTAVLLVGYPVADYAENTFADPQINPQSVAFDAYIQSLAGDGVVYVHWRLGHDVGLDDRTDYFDETHLTPQGAAKMTTIVAAQLDRLGWLALARGPEARPLDGDQRRLSSNSPTMVSTAQVYSSLAP